MPLLTTKPNLGLLNWYYVVARVFICFYCFFLIFVFFLYPALFILLFF